MNKLEIIRDIRDITGFSLKDAVTLYNVIKNQVIEDQMLVMEKQKVLGAHGEEPSLSGIEHNNETHLLKQEINKLEQQVDEARTRTSKAMGEIDRLRNVIKEINEKTAQELFPF